MWLYSSGRRQRINFFLRYKYIWRLDNTDLNCAGPLYTTFSPQIWYLYFRFMDFFFFFFFCHSWWHVESYFPDEGLNLCPLQWKLGPPGKFPILWGTLWRKVCVRLEITICGIKRTSPDSTQTVSTSCPLVSHLSIPLFWGQKKQYVDFWLWDVDVVWVSALNPCIVQGSTGESQGRRSLVGCHLRGRTELDTTEAT